MTESYNKTLTDLKKSEKEKKSTHLFAAAKANIHNLKNLSIHIFNFI